METTKSSIKLLFKKKLLKIFRILPVSIFEKLYLIYLNVLYGSVLRKNKDLKNKYLGKRCFFIGNGPSLKKMNLSYLANEYVFAVNYFALNKQAKIVKPDFYSVIEPCNSVYLEKEYRSLLMEINKLSISDRNLILFFNIDFRNYIEEHSLFKGRKVFYLKALLPMLESAKLYANITQPHSFMDGSPYNAFCCLSYMGFKEIYFVGCDLTLSKSGDFTHFYDYQKSTNLDNHKDWLEADSRKWHTVINFFQKKGVKIFNAGIGGNNDYCPRSKYLSLFK